MSIGAVVSANEDRSPAAQPAAQTIENISAIHFMRHASRFMRHLAKEKPGLWWKPGRSAHCRVNSNEALSILRTAVGEGNLLKCRVKSNVSPGPSRKGKDGSLLFKVARIPPSAWVLRTTSAVLMGMMT